MKVLETQSAHLTNYEVFSHLESMRSRYHGQTTARVKSGNLETVMKELMDYFRASPSPLAYPTTYTPMTIRNLFGALRPYDLTKAEMMMLLNLRPNTVALLDVVIEELDARFSEEQQAEIMQIIVRVLGTDQTDEPGPTNGQLSTDQQP
ncbi:MAG: hypothetical protein M1823_003128 [Watsoniomyces obsoletus]|nr:MAG: hypothetical protein M1823_003128 [Watsoniomyces obsoletus]